MIKTHEFNSKGKLIEKRYDAGQYRELLANKYGALLTFGGSYERWTSARKAIAKLAKATGLTIEQVITDLKTDYEGLSHGE